MRNLENVCIRSIFRLSIYPILFIVFNLMISHSLNTLWIQSLFPNGTFLILIAAFLLFVYFGDSKKIAIERNLFCFSYILYLAIIIYSLLNGDINETKRIVYLGISLILLVKCSIDVDEVIKIGFVFGIAAIYMLIRYNFAQINSLGIIVAFGITCIINFLDCYLKKNKVLVFSVMAVITCIIVSATAMRSAILALIVIHIYSIEKQLTKPKQKIIAVFVFVTAFFVMQKVVINFLQSYLFVDKWGSGDVTSGREEIWKYIIENAGIFGIGSDYINGYAHAHNTLIHIIARYGFILVPIVIMLSIELFGRITTIENDNKGKDAYVRFLLVWGILSLTETIDFVAVWLYGPQLMILVYTSVLYKRSKRMEKLN